MDVPTVPDALREEHGYEAVKTESAEAFSVAMFTVERRVRVYDHGPTAAALDGPGDDVALPLRGAFAGRLVPSPSLATVGMTPDAVFGRVAEKGEEVFAETLSEYGLRDPEPVDSREVERYDGTTARVFRYDAAHPIALDGTEAAVDCAVWAGVWPDEETFDVAGGCYPTKSIGAALPESVTDGDDGAFAADEDADLDRVLSVILNVR